MNARLAPGISFGICDGRVILLDLNEDRYRGLGPRASSALLALSSLGEPLVAETDVALLVAERIITLEGTGTAIAPVCAPAAENSALDPAALLVGHPGDFLFYASMILIVFGHLRGRGLAAVVRRERACRSQAELHISPARATSCAQTYFRMRPLVPLPRNCVLESLSLARCLRRAGVAHDVFFGVRLKPFIAHAWVQSGGQVLSDRVDAVRGLIPVFKL